MKVLFAVDSVFQLMTAINLRLTVYAHDDADIIVYNSTANAEWYCQRLAKTNAFRKCYWAKTPLTYCGSNYSLWKKIPKYLEYLISLVFPEKILNSILGEFPYTYDQFLFNGEGALPDCVFNVCKKKYTKCICYRFEDSYLSYTQLYGSQKGKIRQYLEKIAEFLFGRKDIGDNIRGYYFAAPDMVQYKFPYNILQAPKFSRNNPKLLEVLNTTFEYTPTIDDYHEKYIFFECGDAFFFNNHEDLEYVKLLAQIVGGNNVLIKRHPRIKENRYEGLGVHVAHSTSVPWELIQMNTPLKNKVFITTKSAAALTSEIYFGDQCDAMLLYKGIKGEQGEIGEKFENYMKCFKEKSTNRFWLPSSLEEFAVIIREIEKEK